jgi:hypothetical protein
VGARRLVISLKGNGYSGWDGEGSKLGSSHEPAVPDVPKRKHETELMVPALFNSLKKLAVKPR